MKRKQGNRNMRKLAAALLCVWAASGTQVAVAQEQAPVRGEKVFTGEVMTSWGKKVTPENAWRSYPRPQLKRAKWQNLNGLWDYAITAPAVAKPAQMDG